jgi:glycosyltransferase involved in cell wall biosynthesis
MTAAPVGRSGPVRVLELRSVWGTGGGPEKTILLGAARSDPSRYAVTVCYIRDERDEVYGVASRLDGLAVDYAEVREKHSFDPGIWPKLRQVVRERQIDIVHAHDYKTDLVALLLARTEGVIPLTTAHGWTGHSRREQFYYWADKKLIARFPRVVAVSSEIRDELTRTGTNPSRVTVVLNGIDHTAFRRDRSREREARERLGVPLERFVIGGVGRLEPQKRFDLLMDAVAQIRQHRPDVLLVIAGDGSLRSELEEAVGRHGLTGHCLMLGHQTDVPLVHHTFDLFVQSSKYEGTPNAVLEAMALESPLVATAAGGTAELVRDGQDGLVVPVNDVPTLVAAMRRALASPAETAARVASARARIEGELSFERRMQRLEAIYDELMARFRERPAMAWQGGRA